jgi:uncharacterized protein DUF4345
MERRCLQAVIGLLALVPIAAGLLGGLHGPAAFGIDPGVGTADLDSHVRYLSGLLLAIGLAFWSTVPAIEEKGRRFRLLTAVVFVGGVMRLFSLGAYGMPGWPMRIGLVLELVVTPLLALWQARSAGR